MIVSVHKKKIEIHLSIKLFVSRMMFVYHIHKIEIKIDIHLTIFHVIDDTNNYIFKKYKNINSKNYKDKQLLVVVLKDETLIICHNSYTTFIII